MAHADVNRLSRADVAFISLGLALSALGLGVGIAYWAAQKDLSMTELLSAVKARQCVVAVQGPSVADSLYRCDLPTSSTYVSGAQMLAETGRNAR